MAIKDFTYIRENPLDYDVVKQAAEKQAALGGYQSPQEAIDALNRKKELEANPIASWTGGKWGQALEDQMNKINNRDKFTYDLNGDALYQQYKDKYINQGRLAMQDTIGQASAMTGGYGNSYAATAGNQAYQASLQNLNDIVPQLYQMAYDQYKQEGQDMKDIYSMLNNAYQTEYGEHRDTVSDYNTALDRAINEHYQAETLGFNKWSSQATLLQNAYNAALDFATNEANAKYSNEFSKYQQGEQERQFNESMSKASSSSGGGGGTKPYSMSSAEEDRLTEYIAMEDWGAVDNYIDVLRSRGLSDSEASYWLARIPSSYYKNTNNNKDVIKAAQDRYYNVKNKQTAERM